MSLITRDSVAYETPAAACCQLSEFDVILGRGRTYSKHPGNVHFAALTGYFTVQYNATKSRLIKGRVIKDITDIITSKGGRFLKPTADNLYVQASEQETQNKVGQAMRYRCHRPKRSSYHNNNWNVASSAAQMSLQSVAELIVDNNNNNINSSNESNEVAVQSNSVMIHHHDGMPSHLDELVPIDNGMADFDLGDIDKIF